VPCALQQDVMMQRKIDVSSKKQVRTIIFSVINLSSDSILSVKENINLFLFTTDGAR
jgi:hypothetical protein